MFMTRRKYISATLGGLAVIAVLVYLFSGHETPAGQAPLTSLTTETLPTFEAEFNAAQTKVRVLMFLSPT